MFQRIHIDAQHIGLMFREGAFERVLRAGRHWLFDPFSRYRLVRVSMQDVVFRHDRLADVLDSGALAEEAIDLDLSDHQRGLIWIDGRFSRILLPGRYALFTTLHDVRVEVIDARQTQFDHDEIQVISRAPGVDQALDIDSVERDHTGVLFIDGRFQDVLEPGRYAFWRGLAKSRFVEVDMREQALDISGQELMTADKVTMRMNAILTYKVADPRRSVCSSDDFRLALYRAAQMALREVVGLHELDAFLQDKNALATEVQQRLVVRAQELGIEVIQLGIRDLILPGDMKDLMNRVTEAKKEAEANLIARREETAAIRSQANTAKLLEANPMLMRLRELEILEKVASSTNLRINLGEGGLSEQLSKLI